MYDIACQLTQSGFDYLGAAVSASPKEKGRQGGLLRAGPEGRIQDRERQRGIPRPKALGGQKILAINKTLQDSMSMPYEVDRAPDDLALADYVAKGIELLDKPKGFFLMAEGGKIDWACHANDAAASIIDTMALDKAGSKALEFQKKHPKETLIIVTGDHETGGMSIGFAGTQYSTFFEKVALQKGSFQGFNDSVLGPYKKNHTAADARLEDLLPTIQTWFGFDYAKLDDASMELVQRAFVRSMKGEVERAAQESVYNLYGGYEPLTVTLTHVANQAGVGWTTYSHPGEPVDLRPGPGAGSLQRLLRQHGHLPEDGPDYGRQGCGREEIPCLLRNRDVKTRLRARGRPPRAFPITRSFHGFE
jgi:alkaline phosphatase